MNELARRLAERESFLPHGALELIKRGCEMIAAQEGGSAEAKQLKAAAVLVQEASEIAKTIPNAGESVELRWRIYQMIQSQAESDNAALYKELRCPIHLGLAGENSDPVTLPCGHTFCKTCIAGLFGATTTPRKCPQCRADITVSYASLKTSNTYTPASDSDFYNIRTTIHNKFFYHLSRNDIPAYNNQLRVFITDLFHEIYKRLHITIRDINAYK
jgi:hypothetical protein